jgi:O-antigen ligase
VTIRSRLILAAALVGPLAVFSVLIARPELGFGFAIATVALLLASRSVAWPLALAALPDIVVGLKGSDPFPPKVSVYFTVGWIVLAILILCLREPDALPLGLLASPVSLLTLGLVVMMVVRFGASPLPEYGSSKLQIFVAHALVPLFAATVVARRRKHFELWLTLSVLVSTAAALTLIENILRGKAAPVYSDRLVLATQSGPIDLGRAAGFGLLIGVYLLIAKTTFSRRMIAFVSVPLLCVALMASGSRGPTLALFIGFLLLVGLTLGEGEARKRLLVVGGAVAGAAILVPQLVPGGAISRSFSVLLTGSGGGSNGRFGLFGQAWNIFAAHPLLGVGTGGFGAFATDQERYPHNIVLEAAAELGIVGGLLVLGIIFVSFRAAVRVWKREGPADRQRAALALSLLGFAVVNSMVSGDLAGNGTVWLAAGLGLGLSDATEWPRRLSLRRGRADDPGDGPPPPEESPVAGGERFTLDVAEGAGGDVELRALGCDGAAWVAFEASPAETSIWRPLGARVDRPPFSAAVSLAEGRYDLRAVAGQRDGSIEWSRPVRSHLVDNAPPAAVFLLEPAADTVLRGTVRLTASANLDGVTGFGFECSLDSADWFELTSLGGGESQFPWDTTAAPDGVYWLRAFAYDERGSCLDSEPARVRVANSS